MPIYANKEGETFKRDEEIQREILLYADIINNKSLTDNVSSTVGFWRENFKKFHNLQGEFLVLSMFKC